MGADTRIKDEKDKTALDYITTEMINYDEIKELCMIMETKVIFILISSFFVRGGNVVKRNSSLSLIRVVGFYCANVQR